ncbi:hypothetical protein K1W54_05930 [Micromonospora sp. CPCC 205371]|nr:hypothetical protein [Micromonospora sp. CPCC 205371]
MADHYPARPPVRTPSGLFPSGPPRPTYREPHRVRAAGLTAGLGAGVAWLLFLGLLGNDLRGYVWWTVLAGLFAWGVAGILTRQGDRGVAAGVAIATGLAWSIAVVAVAVRWGMTGDWPLW